MSAHGDWLWPVAAVAAAILVLLALRWLIALLFSTDRSGDLLISPRGQGERTILAGHALTGAVLAEIESYRGVSSARARLLGDPADPLGWRSPHRWTRTPTSTRCASASRPRPWPMPGWRWRTWRCPPGPT